MGRCPGRDERDQFPGPAAWARFSEPAALDLFPARAASGRSLVRTRSGGWCQSGRHPVRVPARPRCRGARRHGPVRHGTSQEARCRHTDYPERSRPTRPGPPMTRHLARCSATGCRNHPGAPADQTQVRRAATTAYPPSAATRCQAAPCCGAGQPSALHRRLGSPGNRHPRLTNCHQGSSRDRPLATFVFTC